MPIPAILAALAPYLPALLAGLGGTAIGAGLAKGGGGGVKNALIGSDPSTQQIENYDPKTRAALDQLLNLSMGQIGQGAFNPQQFGGEGLLQQTLGALNPSKFDFAPIAAEARRGFQEQTIPSIYERFTSMGTSGGRSSALGQHLAQAGAGLEGSLASLQSQYNQQSQQILGNQLRSLLGAQLGQRQQNQGNIMGLLQSGLQPRQSSALIPGQPGLIPQAASYAASMLPYAFLGAK